MEATLEATIRDVSRGKSGARALRRAGKLPAIVYGQGAATTAVAVDPVTFDTIFRKTGNPNTVIDLQVDGASIPVLVKKVSRHPLHRSIEHVDFYQLDKDQVVTVEVPVTTTGRAKGATLGGRIRVLRRTARVTCKYTDIPAQIVIDITPMRIGDFVRASQLPALPGVTYTYESDYNVITLYGKKSLAKMDDEEEEAEGAGEESSESAE